MRSSSLMQHQTDRGLTETFLYSTTDPTEYSTLFLHILASVRLLVPQSFFGFENGKTSLSAAAPVQAFETRYSVINCRCTLLQ